ncbi:MAG: hypothetical protein HY293_21065 [Planctomycetes bacterium]|nr:hypothetical protein [Planctomycetota bacterium]
MSPSICFFRAASRSRVGASSGAIVRWKAATFAASSFERSGSGFFRIARISPGTSAAPRALPSSVAWRRNFPAAAWSSLNCSTLSFARVSTFSGTWTGPTAFSATSRTPSKEYSVFGLG